MSYSALQSERGNPTTTSTNFTRHKQIAKHPTLLLSSTILVTSAMYLTPSMARISSGQRPESSWSSSCSNGKLISDLLFSVILTSVSGLKPGAKLTSPLQCRSPCSLQLLDCRSGSWCLLYPFPLSSPLLSPLKGR